MATASTATELIIFPTPLAAPLCIEMKLNDAALSTIFDTFLGR